jgi:hypothetical protein
LTTTQRMKEFRTAHSESVVKERERGPSRPIQKLHPPFALRGKDGLPSEARSPALLRSSRQPSSQRFGATQGILRSKTEGWLAIRSPFNCPTSLLAATIKPTLGASYGILRPSGEGWWR